MLQAQLAKSIGEKSSGVISNWERNVNKPNADQLVDICQVLDISLSYLLNYYGGETTPLCSIDAAKLAEDYDNLDNHGQRIVRIVADEELARCKAETVAVSASVSVAEMTDAELHAELDRQLRDEKERAERLQVLQNSNSSGVKLA